MEKHKVALIIPTLNEIDGMKWFMPRLKKDWYDEIVVIDGGSTDGTIEYCKDNGYPVYVQKENGLPKAYDEAFMRTTSDIIITLTPDGNSLPELIPGLVDKIKEGCDMVIASRYIGGARSDDDDIFTAFGNHFFTALINLLFNAKYTDVLVGLRAYRRDAIDKMKLRDQDKQGWLKSKLNIMNSWETGSSIRAARLKLKVCDIPGDEPKRIGGVRKMSIIKNGSCALLHVLHEFFMGK